jgi:predicted RNase H-like HicB family nuclease
MSDYHINIFYSDDDAGYVADIPDLKSCSAFGEMSDEALREVLKAKRAWLEARRPLRPVIMEWTRRARRI